MNRTVVRLSVVLLVFSGGVLMAGDGGFNGLALGIDLPNEADGSDWGYVRVPDSETLEPQTFTIEAWIQPLGNGYGFDPVVIGKPRESVGGNYIFSWLIMWDYSTENIWLWLTNTYGSNGVQLYSDGTVAMGTAAHVAMTFDGTWFRLFINGVEDPASPVEAGFSDVYYGDEDILIGAANFTSGFWRRFDGIIDEVRIWDHPRDAATIAGHMDCALDGSEPGLLAYYSFNMADATDDSDQGHDGIIEGPPPPDGPLFPEMYQDCMLLFDGFESGDTSGW